MNAELHALLDGLTDGEHVKVTWTQGKYLFTIEGPVYVDEKYRECVRAIRWPDGTTEAQVQAAARGMLIFRKLLWSDKRTGNEPAPGTPAGP